MPSIYDVVDSVNLQVKELIDSMTEVKAEQLGLDPRAGWRLYVTKECIAVLKRNDRTLQYYGGFEYVEADSRFELGDYVFYMETDDRVHEHLARYYDDLEEREEEEDAMGDFNYVGSRHHY